MNDQQPNPFDSTINTPEHQAWLTELTNQTVNEWLDKTRGLPVTLQLTKLGFSIIDALEVAFTQGFIAGQTFEQQRPDETALPSSNRIDPSGGKEWSDLPDF